MQVSFAGKLSEEVGMDVKAGDYVQVISTTPKRVMAFDGARVKLDDGTYYSREHYEFRVVSVPTVEEPEPGSIWEYVPTGNYFARLGNGKWIGLYGGATIQWENFIQAFRDNKMRRVK
jgi:hypothetical protein